MQSFAVLEPRLAALLDAHHVQVERRHEVPMRRGAARESEHERRRARGHFRKRVGLAELLKVVGHVAELFIVVGVRLFQPVVVLSQCGEETLLLLVRRAHLEKLEVPLREFRRRQQREQVQTRRRLLSEFVALAGGKLRLVAEANLRLSGV